jgi:hypothetical protein
MNHSGGPSKSTSTFNPNKKGLGGKSSDNKFGISSSDGKGKKFGKIKALDINRPRREEYCGSCGATEPKIVGEDIEL